jgi:hypothetical protein
MATDLDVASLHAAQSPVTTKRKRGKGRWPEGVKGRPRVNRTIPERLDIDLDRLPPSSKLTAIETAALLRCTCGTIDRLCGDDPADPYRPLHPIRLRGKRLFSVANVRDVLRSGIPRKNEKRGTGRHGKREQKN